MEVADVVDLGREALWIAFLVAAPMLGAGMLVGLVISFLQALTQIQDQAIAFVPKVVAMGLVFAVALPWLLAIILEYSERLFHFGVVP
ncbi:MAG: flagellar biosynthetic protein FliQ [Thermoguttaceae bacterium]|nr:flagellar biosynthetic protein FliQ [Thermoguttaceae bacterium]MDW8079297.1 flagellar biosynthetic protein FliQ [Thermoguttaceae bacterium]